MKRLFLALCGALVGATAWWLFRGHWVLGGKEWPVAPNIVPWPAPAWLLPLAAIFIFGGFAAWCTYDRFRRAKTVRERRISTMAAVIALSLLALLWPWSLVTGVSGVTNLVAATYSDVATGYFGAAYVMSGDVRSYTRDYAATAQHAPSAATAHVATHPPGATLFYYGARHLYEGVPPINHGLTAAAQLLTSTSATDINRQAALAVAASTGVAPIYSAAAVGGALWCALLLSLAGALTVPAVYLLGAGDTGNEGRGLCAAALYVFAPTVGLFTFGLDTAIACGAAWSLVCCLRALRGERGAALWWAAAGAATGFTSFLSFGALAVGLIALCVLLQSGVPHREWHSHHRGRHIAWLAAGFVAAWVLIVLLFPQQPLRIYQQAMAAHHAATLVTRSYLLWAPLNLAMFALFAGWPAVLAALWAASRPRAAVEAVGGERDIDGTLLIGRATLLVVLILTLSGQVRGEVERLWFFLLPPLCALAATTLVAEVRAVAGSPGGTDSRGDGDGTALMAATSGKTGPATHWLWAGAIALQTCQSLMMAAALAPLVRP